MADLRQQNQHGLPTTPDNNDQQPGHGLSRWSNSESQRSNTRRLTPSSHETRDSTSPATSVDDPDAAADDLARRKKKNRGSGAFLLQPSSSQRRSRSQRPPVRMAILASKKAADAGRPNTAEESSKSRVSYDNNRFVNFSGSSQGSLDQDNTTNAHGLGLQDSRQSIDADSAQIVHMALNLSESRRIASRRVVSRATPPRLAPMPDSSTGSDLRQQLKQQRRASHTISPKPQMPSPRIGSGLRLTSPLQAAFDLGHETSYNYHFSASTLARAQKAKEQLELLAQYRRLLEVLPPLAPRYNRPITSSPPGSPPAAGKVFSWTAAANRNAVGRKYNPLQYIRNRKVRARERRVIDGERQGFGDVDEVRTWVDRFYQDNALSTNPFEEPSMPEFPGADAALAQMSGDGTVKAAPRTRRARVDWFIEPCDIIADAYWLEQDDNRSLIEDRQWRKIFPHRWDLSRPMSRQVDDAGNVPVSFQPLSAEHPLSSSEGLASRIRSESHVHSGTVERPKDSRQNIKDTNPWLSQDDQDFSKPWAKKDSASEFSDSEHEPAEKRNKASHQRTDTSITNNNDILQKQMLEMIAQENRDRAPGDIPISDIGQLVPTSMITPERNVSSKSNSRLQSRRASLVEFSDSEPHRSTLEKIRAASPPRFRFGQHKEPAPHNYSGSLDPDSSLPTSPEMKPFKSYSEAPADMELSPRLRPSSPSRNPISKIKHLIQDKSPESNLDSPEGPELLTVPRQDNSQSPESANHSDEGNGTLKRPANGASQDGAKGHRRASSLRHRQDENIGIRGIFKGHTIRGSVSKIGDILRKKDGSGEPQGEFDVTDESDSDRGRARSKTSTSVSDLTGTQHRQYDTKQPKHFLDKMPEFQHTPAALERAGAREGPKTSPPTAQSTAKSKLLSPPQVGPRSSSSSLSPQRGAKRGSGDADISEAESVQSRMLEGIRDANKRLNSAIALPPYNVSHRKSRQWSIADDQNRVSQKTQLSRREIARLKTLVLSSGIKAMEIDRRAQEKHKPFVSNGSCDSAQIPWADIQRLCPEQAKQVDRLVPFYELYPIAAQSLSIAIQMSGQRWQTSADRFTSITSPELHKRIGGVRSRLGDDLSELTRRAADEADATSKNLALDQPLKVKHVVDVIEKMLRKRRRRLRWVRRALWLSVEWLVVGFMWYVWFVVMILRIFLGIGNGIWTGVKWILWLE